jgi:hypothetical protein
MDKMATPASPERDVCDRIAARYGLHSSISGRVISYLDDGSRVDREATDQEVELWCALVPRELRELCDRVWSSVSPLELVASPEEVYCSVLHNAITYLSAVDFAVLRRLPCFAPSNLRENLRDGIMGSVHGKWTVCVSRHIPVGYFHAPKRGSARTDVLHPRRPPPDLRTVVPPVPEEELWAVDLEPCKVLYTDPSTLGDMRKSVA